MLIFGLCFVLYFLKLSAGIGFWSKLRRTNPQLHQVAIKYQRSLGILAKAQLDLKFLYDCKENKVFPKFVRWKNLNRMKKRNQRHYYNLLLTDAIKEKNSHVGTLKRQCDDLKHELSGQTTWMKFRLICFSINRLLGNEKNKVTARHERKLNTLIELKQTADAIEENPNDTIINLSGRTLSSDEINVLKLGLRHGIATRPNQFEIMAVSEDVWDQISRLNKFKDGPHIQDKIKNSLRSFTYSCTAIDLDLCEFNTDRKKIKTLTELSKELSILKPNKGNGIVVMKRSDYISSVASLFSDASRFKLLDTDPTLTRLNSLQSFLCTLRQTW